MVAVSVFCICSCIFSFCKTLTRQFVFISEFFVLILFYSHMGILYEYTDTKTEKKPAATTYL